MEKIKNFIHKHENLEKIVLTLWGILMIFRAKRIFRKIQNNSPKGKNPKVIILSLRTLPTTNLVYFDAVFGHAFKKLGCDIKMLYCDGLLDSCEANTVFRNQKAQCFICKTLGPFVKNALNLDYISYRQYISELEIEEIKRKVADLDNKDLLDYEYLGVNVGKHAVASEIRYFLFGYLDINNPKEISVLREKLVYAMIAVKVAEKIYLKEKPDVFFMLHGIYSTWGPFRDYYRLKGIDTVIYIVTTSRFGYFAFNRNSRPNDIASVEAWSEFKKLPLGEEEKKQIDDYLLNRRKGKIGDQEMYRENFNNNKKDEILELLSKKKYSRRYIMYPNVPWDPTVEGRVSKIFENTFSWLDKTIEFFKERKNYQLIIKPHPAELAWEKCSKGIKDYICEKHGSLPENIIVLEPSVPLRAYDLIDNNTIAIVFNGTLGLELSAIGIPVFVVSDIHYKEGADVVYKIDTLKKYLELLDNPEELILFTKTNIELAKKYAYFYFFKSMIKIPFYRDDKWSTIDWNVVRDVKKLLDDDNNIIKICKNIINKKDIVVPFPYEKHSKNFYL